MCELYVDLGIVKKFFISDFIRKINCTHNKMTVLRNDLLPVRILCSREVTLSIIYKAHMSKFCFPARAKSNSKADGPVKRLH